MYDKGESKDYRKEGFLSFFVSILLILLKFTI